jgi:hypothetical protein
MSRRILLIGGMAGALLLAIVVASVAAQRCHQSSSVLRRPSVARAQFSPSRTDPRFPFPVAPTTLTNEQRAALAASQPSYTVDPYPLEPGQERSEAEFRVVKDLAAQIAALAPVPDERRACYAWSERPDYPILFQSWGCQLRQPKQIPGGWALELLVTPRATNSQNNRINVYNLFVEEYTLTDEAGLRFVRGYPHPDSPPTPQFGRSSL